MGRDNGHDAVAPGTGHLQKKFGRLSSPMEGIRILSNLSSKGVGPATAALAGAYYFGSGGIERQPEKAISLLTSAAANGDPDAARRLIGLYRDAPMGLIKRSSAKAESMLEQISPVVDPGWSAREKILIAAAFATNREKWGTVSDLLDKAPPSVQSSTLTQLYSVNSNAFLYAVQRHLQARNLYADGKVDGLAGAKTVRSIMKLCEDASVTCVGAFQPRYRTQDLGIAEGASLNSLLKCRALLLRARQRAVAFHEITERRESAFYISRHGRHSGSVSDKAGCQSHHTNEKREALLHIRRQHSLRA